MLSVLVIFIVLFIAWHFSMTSKEEEQVKEEEPLEYKCIRENCKGIATFDNPFCSKCIDNMFLS